MKSISILSIFILFLTSCTSSKVVNQQKAGQYFEVEVVQNGKVKKEKNGVISLKKAPFKFKITLLKTDNVDVSASWGKYYFDYPDDKDIFECNNDDLEGCRFVGLKAGAEDQFNEYENICVGNGDYQFNWFYNKESIDWHRFDKGVIVKNGVIHAEMTVNNILDLDARDDGQSGYKYPTNEINKDIYMVFATSKYTPQKTSELQRKKFILKFK